MTDHTMTAAEWAAFFDHRGVTFPGLHKEFVIRDLMAWLGDTSKRLAGGITYYCQECLARMVDCPWGGHDCPRCDKGHHDGPDYELPFTGSGVA